MLGKLIEEVREAWNRVTTLEEAIVGRDLRISELNKKIRILENHIEELEAELEEGINSVGTP